MAWSRSTQQSHPKRFSNSTVGSEAPGYSVLWLTFPSKYATGTYKTVYYDAPPKRIPTYRTIPRSAPSSTVLRRLNGTRWNSNEVTCLAKENILRHPRYISKKFGTSLHPRTAYIQQHPKEEWRMMYFESLRWIWISVALAAGKLLYSTV